MEKKYKVPIILLGNEDMVGLRKCVQTGEPLYAQIAETMETDNERGDKTAIIMFRPWKQVKEFIRRQVINDNRKGESVKMEEKDDRVLPSR